MPESESWELGKEVARWAWSKREQIAGSLRGLYSWFRQDRGVSEQRGILILGPGGVGKTTLAKLLSGEYDLLLDVPGEYEESLGIENYALADAPELEVVVPPGQQHRREATWTELLQDISADKFRGVIFVGAYGYHTLGQISFKDHRLYAGSKPQFLKDFRRDRIHEELRILRQLAPHIATARKKIWLLTLVTKQDLWWPQRSQVESHYQEGDYKRIIEQVAGQLDVRRFRHEFLFASLVISNFATGRGELLQKNVAGYDQGRQVEFLRRLFETVDALRRWETDP